MNQSTQFITDNSVSSSSTTLPTLPTFVLSETSFVDKIKCRGEVYYEENRVSDLYNMDSNIYAMVDSYSVMLGQTDCYCTCQQTITCDCPDCNYYCAHLYALLLKLRQEYIPTDIKSHIRSLTKEELIDLVENIIDKNISKPMEILRLIMNLSG